MNPELVEILRASLALYDEQVERDGINPLSGHELQQVVRLLVRRRILGWRDIPSAEMRAELRDALARHNAREADRAGAVKDLQAKLWKKEQEVAYGW